MMTTTAPECAGSVLVVDDDPLVLRMVARVLQRCGIEVHQHERPFGVLNRIVELRPALVLLDVHMPGLDGASLTALVRDDPAVASSRIILFSGMDEQLLAAKARACGADGYLLKVPALGNLAQSVSRLLRH